MSFNVGDKVYRKIDRYTVMEATITGFWYSRIGKVVAILDSGSLGVQTAILDNLSYTPQIIKDAKLDLDEPIEIA